MRRGIEARLKQLEALLPTPEPKVRFIVKTTMEQGGRVLSTGITEGMGKGQRVLFRWAEGDPDAAEKKAAFEAFVASGKFEILHMHIIYTRDPECRLGEVKTCPPWPQDAHRASPEPRSTQDQGSAASEDVLARGNEAELRAEVTRLTERLAELGECLVLVERKGNEHEAN